MNAKVCACFSCVGDKLSKNAFDLFFFFYAALISFLMLALRLVILFTGSVVGVVFLRICAWLGA